MKEKTLDILEFPKILNRLADLTFSPMGRELALSLRPYQDHREVALVHQEAVEARRFFEVRPGFSAGSPPDPRALAHQAALGGVLIPQDLLDMKEALVTGRLLKTSILPLANQLPTLADIAREIADLTPLINEIGGCVGPRGEVLDSASPLLGAIRSQLKVAHSRLLERLSGIINSPLGRHVLQEPLVTTRSGRYVLPIKAEFRGEFKGIVHDVSASGATVFMEPMATVDAGNTWRELQIQEELETERILRRLSALVGEQAQGILQTAESIAKIDLALAKAKYGLDTRGIHPKLVPPDPSGKASRPAGWEDAWPQRTPLRLVNARHPLLKADIVPITVELGEDFFILVITGPNTGGKTVALKTVGLLALMNQAGIPIPAEEGSALPVFSGIYSDIGDEQSIEQSLSTFSSHMGNIIQIIAAAGSDSLVLLDELGAGTDPAEGSALARGILQYLLKNGVSAICTTHHTDLKTFAHATPGVMNASVEFDPETLAPTYRLSIGLPGRSNAMAIARRLGLPPEILDDAHHMLAPDHVQVENLLAQIQEERQKIEEQRQAADVLRREAEEAQRLTRERLRELEDTKASMLEAARQEVDSQLAEITKRLRQAAAYVEEAEKARERESLASAAAELTAVDKELASPPWRPPSPHPPVTLLPGDMVRIRGLEQEGEVLTGPDANGEVEVQLGALRAKIHIQQLIAAPSHPQRAAQGPMYSIPAVSPPTEVHLRGMKVEEALEKLDRYLNDAYLAGLPFLRVIHGKGTGTMRRAVREVLARHPLVRSFKTAPPNAGGEGVTEAELA